MSTITETLNAAIEQSASTNSIIRVEVADFDAAILTLADSDGEIDHVRTDAGVDVWGWSDTTPANGMDWRLSLVLA
jgi:hypothetical protein